MRPGVRIGIDVGAVRVGVAASDPAGLLATPVATVQRTGSSADEAQTSVAEIVALVTQRSAIEVVIGLPRSLSGAEGAAAAAARAYAQLVADAVQPVPVRMVDERLTTVIAHQALHRSGRNSRRHRSVVDQVAAVEILQQALDIERGAGKVPGVVLVPSQKAPKRADNELPDDGDGTEGPAA